MGENVDDSGGMTEADCAGDQKCLDDLSYTTENGVIRRISKTSIRNIVQYLLYQKSNIISTQTIAFLKAPENMR